MAPRIEPTDDPERRDEELLSIIPAIDVNLLTAMTLSGTFWTTILSSRLLRTMGAHALPDLAGSTAIPSG
jgi:hypothetical protein